MGGLSSFCRAFYAVLIPPGHEAAFYALYAVTDKGSSVIGPAIVGRIVDTTGSVRSGFWFLAVLILLPGPLVWKVDSENGRRDALQMAKVLDKTGGIGERDIALGDAGAVAERGDGGIDDEAHGLLTDSDEEDEL